MVQIYGESLRNFETDTTIMFKEDTLAGKRILVTGGGSGLGLAMARAFASVGAKVAICGRTEAKLQAAAPSLGSQGGYWVCDVRDYDAVGRMFDEIYDRWGGLDGLVNNAAGNFLCASEDLTPGGFKAVVDIVLHGTFNCTQHFGKRQIAARRPGTILNIVATYTETGCAFVLPSACAKAGVYAMTTTLAYEWGVYGIRCVAIAPGPFPTEGAWSRLVPDPRFQQTMLEKHPMRRVGDASELAHLAVFLMSDMAPYINGECVVIDGGERLQGSEFNAYSHFAPREQLKEIFRALKPSKK
ncbi:MAG: SDR family oxidoreductase [Bacteroidia bacterium]|nr:SDR family oxidoreductase [Bacteroidia bacterium]MDW8333281.1 SDR family oxidoreductase [Bacteroidia bacterium]